MIPVLFQDDWIAVCLKPPGTISQDGPGDALPERLRGQLGCGIFPVHRLDRDAGGVMIYAKSSRAAGALSGEMAQGRFQKQYVCVTQGRPQADEGAYWDLLLHDKARNKSFVVKRMRGGVREAGLEDRLRAVRAGSALVAVKLLTARTHQIREQFASRGTPLLGDRKYGGGDGPLMLWSCALGFRHPKNGRWMAFSAPPEDRPWEAFREELDALR